MSEHGVAKINGYRLAHEITDFVDPWLQNKETQIWVHGFMGCKEVFCRQVPEFCRRFRVVTYDQRGFGASSAPKRGSYGIKDYIADLEGLVDYLGVDRFHLVGHSFGGMVAQGFAVRNPSRLHSLVLIATKASSTPENPERRDFVNGFIKTRGMRAFAEAFAEAYADPSEPEISKWNVELSARNHAHVVMANAEGRVPFDFTPELHKITAPTLILATKSDTLIPAREVRTMAKAIPNATVRWYEGSHGAPLKKPGVVAQPMHAFYKRIKAGAP